MVLKKRSLEMTVLRLQGQICISKVDGLRKIILEKAQSLWYAIHLGATEMDRDLR